MTKAGNIGATALALAILAASGGVALAARQTPTRTSIEKKLAALSAAPSAASAAADPIDRARDALGRADKAHEGGDETRAALLEGLADEWTETAVGLVEAQKLEREADAAEQRARANTVKLRRAQALQEETLARVGRAKKRLAELEALRAQGLKQSTDRKPSSAKGGQR